MQRTEAAAPETHVAYMAGGCFWGLERAMQNVDGVLDTTVGYAQSITPDPTYRMVCSERHTPWKRCASITIRRG